MNLYPLPKLPAARNGVAYTYKSEGVIHAVGTCTAWGGVGSEVTLQPGRYSLAGSVGTDRQNLYVQITVDGKNYNTISTEPFTITTAGTYSCGVITRNGSTVDADIMPVLTAISDGTSETDG